MSVLTRAPGRTAAEARRSDSRAERPIGTWAFLGVAVASFGGPLALAGLGAPGLVDDASESAGLEMLAAAALFAVPLIIWLRYARHISSSGGLYAFVEAAAGRRIALVQGTLWIVSYLLYVIYTGVQIVYDLLPAVIPGERSYQTVLVLAIPVGLAAVMIAGRTAALAVLGLVAGSQLVLAGALDGVTLAHVSTSVSTFGTGASLGEGAKATAQTSLLYICGSLPLFLGGEVASPVRTIRRGLIGVYLLTAAIIVAAVAPLATSPGLARTEIPGMSVAQQFSGLTLARAIGIGIAVSTAGVMLCEYLALSRLIHAIGSWRTRPIAIGIGAVIVAAAPFSLIDPEGFYESLVKPSLIALWVSQLIVFAVFPRFARQQGQRMLPAWALSSVACACAVYGLIITLQHASS